MTGRAERSLERALETPQGKYRYARRLFATIADRYDLITRLLSFGCDQRWKRMLVRRAGVAPGMRVLDLACGTGDLAELMSRRGATVIGLDFTAPMIARARRKGIDHASWVVGDMTHLPLPAEAFDVVTIGYGLRNVVDLPRALDEIAATLRPGGVLAALDFERPESASIRAIYLGYLTVVGSALGAALHGDPGTYRYIPATVARYPGARPVAVMMRDAGLTAVEHVPIFGGLMAAHFARKRSEPPPPHPVECGRGNDHRGSVGAS
ncbi:MAG: ubiquinone/menaquinone biosynthesis methyltransferase [Acidobacteria bacterium]|nr:ubiquinone/menaquinone biosynthesis methyltransferase [Acidobacteriota bacterium]